MTNAYPVVRGNQGGSPEIHEKLNARTGRGIVVFFTHGAGTFTCVTRSLERQPSRISGADRTSLLENGRVRLTVKLGEDEARVVFFE